MSDDRLFEVEPLPEAVTVKLSADAQRTLRQRRAIAAGRHPANGLPIDIEHTCGECEHLQRYQYHSRTYIKCPNHALGESHSAASDMRVSWPACPLFSPIKETTTP